MSTQRPLLPANDEWQYVGSDPQQPVWVRKCQCDDRKLGSGGSVGLTLDVILTAAGNQPKPHHVGVSGIGGLTPLHPERPHMFVARKGEGPVVLITIDPGEKPPRWLD